MQGWKLAAPLGPSGKVCFVSSALLFAVLVCAPIGVRADTVALAFTSDAGGEQFVDARDTVGWTFSVRAGKLGSDLHF